MFAVHWYLLSHNGEYDERFNTVYVSCFAWPQVDTVKRMCVKKLPKVLVIQLKRFDYDWERLAIIMP